MFMLSSAFFLFLGCPFVCSVSDTSRVSLTLRNLELIPVNEIARFHMGVDGSGSAELAVSVRGKVSINTFNYVSSGVSQ